MRSTSPPVPLTKIYIRSLYLTLATMSSLGNGNGPADGRGGGGGWCEERWELEAGVAARREHRRSGRESAKRDERGEQHESARQCATELPNDAAELARDT